MTVKLLLSLSMIALVISGMTGATYAFFSQGSVLSDNTFSTGNIDIGDFNYTNLTVANLVPGVPVMINNFAVQYTGSVNADLYMGARGSSAQTAPQFIADHLYLRVFTQGTSTVIWEGYTDALSGAWRKIATDTSAGWKAYDLQFTLNAATPNEHMGVTNTDTQILIYAVQTGGPVPTTVPYLTDSWPW